MQKKKGKKTFLSKHLIRMFNNYLECGDLINININVIAQRMDIKFYRNM